MSTTTTSERTKTSDSNDACRSGTRDNSVGNDNSAGADDPAGADNTEEGRNVKRPKRSTRTRPKDATLRSERHHVLVGTPFGGLYLVAAGGSLVAIYHEAHDPPPGPAGLGQPLHTPDEGSEDDISRSEVTAEIPAAVAAVGIEASAADTEALDRARQELTEYFDGRRRSFSLPLTITGTAFQKDVWHALVRIPFGERCSYRDIADSLGNPRMGRAIGAAVRANPLSIAIPGHRVVSSSGKVVGYAAGTDVKSALLDFERSFCETPEPTESEAQGSTPGSTPRSTSKPIPKSAPASSVASSPDHIR